MMAFVEFYLMFLNKLKNKSFSKVHRILEIESFWATNLCTLIKKKKSLIGLEIKLKKYSKNHLETFVIKVNP
jgi:uncharacterized membrane protein